MLRWEKQVNSLDEWIKKNGSPAHVGCINVTAWRARFRENYAPGVSVGVGNVGSERKIIMLCVTEKMKNDAYKK